MQSWSKMWKNRRKNAGPTKNTATLYEIWPFLIFLASPAISQTSNGMDFNGLSTGMPLDQAFNTAVANGGSCRVSLPSTYCRFGKDAAAYFFINRHKHVTVVRGILFGNFDYDEFRSTIISRYKLTVVSKDFNYYKTPTGLNVKIYDPEPNSGSFDISDPKLAHEDDAPIVAVPRF